MADIPQRPARTTKPLKESSGLLMSVIRTLSASKSNEQRDTEKKKLEVEYYRSDKKLDTLITSNDQALKDVMQIFKVVSTRLSESRARIRAIKENLSACKELLHCKRDELKVRWLEGVEHKHVMLLLEQIDEVSDVGEAIGMHVGKKHYLHATRLLVTSLKRLDTDLKMVEALKEVHTDLLTKKERLQDTLIEELHKHLYQRWTREVLALRRQGSGRESLNTFSRIGSDRTSRSDKTRKNLMDAFVASKDNDESQSLEEDINISDPESDSRHFMAIIIECLALLGKLPDAVETMKRRMQKELGVIIQQTSQQILDYHPSVNNDETPLTHLRPADSRDVKLLQELLQVEFEQFRLVVAAHESVLQSMRASADKHGLDLFLYTMADVWSKVQAALQVQLSEYLECEQLGVMQQQTPTVFTEASTDISLYFSKKRPSRPKAYPLFKFESSYHAMTMHTYFLEQQANSEGTPTISVTDANGGIAGSQKMKNKFGEKLLVCSSSSHNITAIYNPLQSFIKEIEEALACPPGTHCTLHVYITEYIDEFLLRLNVETAKRLEQEDTRSVDQWRTCKDPAALKLAKASHPLLQSTMGVWQCIEDLRWMMVSLPQHADHFVTMMCKNLRSYKETCQAAYIGITQPDSEDKRIISACTAKDEDINRFLRDLPNWEALQEGASSPDGEESPEKVGERNMKEAEILIHNHGEQLITQHEILSDPIQLHTLAHLQESLEWFGGCITKFATSLPVKSSHSGVVVSGDTPPVSDASVLTLISLAKDFEELAHTCLLVLHLEVRLHCFYYLHPLARRGSSSGFASGLDSQEPDGEVTRLNKDLSTIDEALTNTLHARKCKYIFEGLGPLIANILMTCTVHIRRINSNGIKKMCRNIFSVQQQLTNITMTRELALDRARQYYELLYLTPDELLNNIMNGGKQFTELEYINLLKLLHQSTTGQSPELLQGQLRRLSEILGETGVTV